MKVLFFLMLISLVFFFGCEKKECATAADCTEQRGQSVACADGKCSYTMIQNVCGNSVCEKNAKENVCSCSSDCKAPKCDGPYKLEKPGQRPEDARFLRYYCDDKMCKIGAQIANPRYLKEIERETPFGKVKVKVDYVEPMDVAKKDKFLVTLQLIEFSLNAAKERGVELYQISFFSRDRFAEKTVNNVFLKEVRLPIVIPVSLTLPSVPYREQASSITMKIDYGYVRREKVSATEYKDTPRTGSLEYELPDRITFIESGEAS